MSPYHGLADVRTFYPQPPLPATTAINDPSAYTLCDDFVVTDVPQIREFYWNITAATGSPDGYARQIFAVNNQFPGPLIEANEGDTIVVHVENLLELPQTIR